MPPKVLTIGGSDSGGAAGLQADLKTFTALGVYGMSAITAVTAQNSVSVNAVEWLTPNFLIAQLEAVLSDYGADAVKTGFLGRMELITAVSAKLQTYQLKHIIIDPVLVNHRQQAMFPDSVRLGYLSYLLPIATLLTPNLAEAALLVEQPTLTSLAKVHDAAKGLHQFGAKAVLIKGFREENQVVDVLFDGHTFTEFRDLLIETENTHGAGDSLSAAIAAYLARGDALETAVFKARQFTLEAIRKAKQWQLGQGHGPLAHF